MLETNNLLLVGPRRSGKSILAREIASRHQSTTWYTTFYKKPLSLPKLVERFDSSELIVMEDFPVRAVPALVKDLSEWKEAGQPTLPRLIVCVETPEDTKSAKVLAQLEPFFFRINLMAAERVQVLFCHTSLLSVVTAQAVDQARQALRITEEYNPSLQSAS